MAPKPANLLDRFWRNVDTSGDCWLWRASTNSHGYGQMHSRPGQRMFATHRLSWEIANCAPVPAGLHVLHRCDVRRCVNPAHLYVGTHQDNMRDQSDRARQPGSRLTKCKSGHPFDVANTYWRPSGARDCRACIRERARRYKDSLKVTA